AAATAAARAGAATAAAVTTTRRASSARRRSGPPRSVRPRRRLPPRAARPTWPTWTTTFRSDARWRARPANPGLPAWRARVFSLPAAALPASYPAGGRGLRGRAIVRADQRVVVALVRPIAGQQVAIAPAALRQQLLAGAGRADIERGALAGVFIDDDGRRPLVGGQQARRDRPEAAGAQVGQALGVREIIVQPSLQIARIGAHIRPRRVGRGEQAVGLHRVLHGQH